MKKTIGIISICCLLLLLPIAGAIPSHNPLVSKHLCYPPQSTTRDDPPAWAKGNFTGEWGLTLFGIPVTPLGWIEGYYQNIGLGNLEAIYAPFNETNATSFLRGIMIWIFFLGGAGSIATGNATWVSGIGVANETHFYWRLNAIIGPSFYIHCEYAVFDNRTG